MKANGEAAAPGEALLKQIDYSVLQQCMHCGMCLPTCPTYVETGRERNSPRGRIALMRAVADDRLPIDTEFASEMSYCVGCLACQTACPAGVDYAHLLESARADVENTVYSTTLTRSWFRWFTLRFLFEQPWRLRFAGRLVWLSQCKLARAALGLLARVRLIPTRLKDLERQSPRILPPFSAARIAEREKPEDKPRFRVGLLTGCVQDLAYAHVNRATADVLLANGCEVETPRNQPCCGSLHAHNGDLVMARRLARRMLDRFDPERVDAIVTNAGGCGSHLKKYGELLADEPEYRERAHSWDRKVRDVHEWLVEIDFRPPIIDSPGQRVAYDASCHLCHGQGVRSQPLDVLRAIPSVEPVNLPESDWCCGSAGIYSLLQPESSQKLLERKLGHVSDLRIDVLATGNLGCQLQLANGIEARPDLRRIRVVHPIELLAEAYAAEREVAVPATHDPEK